MCVEALLTEFCGELQLTREDPGPRCRYLWKPRHLDHIVLEQGAEQSPLCDISKGGECWNAVQHTLINALLYKVVGNLTAQYQLDEPSLPALMLKDMYCNKHW